MFGLSARAALKRHLRVRLYAGVVIASAALMSLGGVPANASNRAANALPAVNEVEPNGSIATANSILAPTSVSGSISTTSDTDYFRVVLPAGKSLTATLTASSSSDFDLYLLKASGTTLARSEKGAGSVEMVTYANGGSSSVTLYVRVLRFAGLGAYGLTLQQ